MKRILKTMVCIITLLVLCMSLVACSNDNKQKPTYSKEAEQKSNKFVKTEKKEIKLGCMSMTEPIITWLKEGLEPKGYDVEIVVFDGNHLPATALKDGNIDGLILNYLPWLKTFNEKNDCNLHMVEPYIYYGYTAIYSSKYKSVEELPKNAQITVAGDPTNLEKALIRLQAAGLITLGEKKESFYTKLDIVDNPKNIEIIETEVTSVVRSINDVDAIIASADGIRRSGMDPKSFIYPSMSELEAELDMISKGNEITSDKEPIFIAPDFGLIIDPKDIDAQWVKEAVTVYKSNEFKEKFNDYFKGAYILYDN